MGGVTEYDAWAEVYDAWTGDTGADIPFYAQLAREADGPIVEVAVGTGRVAVAVAQQTGRPVLGLDSSAAMLDVARERARGLPVELRQADMRDFVPDDAAALIYVPGRSLLHLHGWCEKRDAFRRIAASLRPAGASPSTASSSPRGSLPSSTASVRRPAASRTRPATSRRTAG